MLRARSPKPTHAYRPDNGCRDRRRSSAGRFRGLIMQVPPAFFGHQSGRRARLRPGPRRRPAGIAAPARPGRQLRVDRPARTPIPRNSRFRIRQRRLYALALARDLARACGTVGHITVLRRLRVGPFLESMAVPLDRLLDPAHTPPALAEFLLAGRDRAGRHPGTGRNARAKFTPYQMARP